MIRRTLTGHQIHITRCDTNCLATIPSLPGYFSREKIPEAARENAEQAIALYFGVESPCDALGCSSSDDPPEEGEHVKLVKQYLYLIPLILTLIIVSLMT